VYVYPEYIQKFNKFNIRETSCPYFPKLTGDTVTMILIIRMRLLFELEKIRQIELTNGNGLLTEFTKKHKKELV